MFHGPFPLTLVSHLSLDCRYISRWVVFKEIFKALTSVSIHNNIQTVTFTKNTWKKQSKQLYCNSAVTTSLLDINLKRIFDHFSFHLMNTIIYLTHPKSLSKTINNIISWLELARWYLISVKYLLKILRGNDEKFEKYWLVLVKYYLKLPALVR